MCDVVLRERRSTCRKNRRAPRSTFGHGSGSRWTPCRARCVLRVC